MLNRLTSHLRKETNFKWVTYIHFDTNHCDDINRRSSKEDKITLILYSICTILFHRNNVSLWYSTIKPHQFSSGSFTVLQFDITKITFCEEQVIFNHFPIPQHGTISLITLMKFHLTTANTAPMRSVASCQVYFCKEISCIREFRASVRDTPMRKHLIRSVYVYVGKR